MTNQTIEFPLPFPLNADLPFPPEAAPFCPNITMEWLEEEGYTVTEWTLHRGVAFNKSMILMGKVYHGCLCMTYDSWGKRWFTSEYIDQATDLSQVIANWEESGYVLNHGVGHVWARQNFLGHTLSDSWRFKADWDTELERRRAWWESIPVFLKIKSN